MKINKTKSNKKKLILVGVIVLILMVGGTVSAYYVNNKLATNTNPTSEQTSEEKVNLEPPTEEEEEAGSTIKEDLVKNEDKNNSSDVTLSIDTPLYDVSSKTLQIRTRTSKPISDKAICSLVLSSPSVMHTEDSVGIQQMSNYSTCKGWNVTSLDSGTWSIRVKIDDNGKVLSSESEVKF